MWTKAEVAKLTVEQQEVLARFELSKARQRQKLLEQARGLDWRARYWPLYFFAMFIILLAFYYFIPSRLQKPEVLYFPAGMMIVSLVVFHIGRVNRRLDALVELLDFDHKNQDGSKNLKDEKVG